ncbi:MAG: endonuclease/exonuclease/phosphatase family protein [Planctomycetes bacterium]|nr:endonuclease/exonuclease/phosphatase family protein [Planctomycetota bacterium]
MLSSVTHRFLCLNLIMTFLVSTVAQAQEAEKSFVVADSPKLTEGANLRIMSYNILSEEWNAKTPVDGRKDSIASTILYFSPDVVGLQEVSAKWHEALPRLISSKYVMVNQQNTKGQSNYTCMAYNKEKVKLLDSGNDYYSVGSGGTKIRLVTWGHYEKIDSGKKFLVMNTHWCIHKENRVVQAHELADLFAQYRKKFSCPVISTGDHNSDEKSEEYQLYAKQTGMKNARETAVKVVRDFRSTHSLGKKPRARQADSIDQIFYTDDLKCLLYNILVDRVILDASDHTPIYADFKMGES